MLRNNFVLQVFVLLAVFISAFLSINVALSKVKSENGSIYIVDMHGERWDVTQAKSIGFLPERFQHGIGHNAFLPLDDSNLTIDDRNLTKNARVIGISDGKEANAYSIRRLWRHEIANSTIGEQPIAAAY